MYKYTFYCTDEQTKRAFELGAPCEVIHDYGDDGCGDGETWYDGHFLLVPTTQQMIGWLREKRFILFVHELNEKYEWVIESNYGLDRGEETSYEQAEFAAIDAALDYLEKGE